MTVAVIYILPTLVMYSKGTREPELWPNKKINLGLDLQGGMHLVLEVQTEKAVENAMDAKLFDLKKALRGKQIIPKMVKRIENSSDILVSIPTPESQDMVSTILKADFQDVEITSQKDLAGTTDYILSMIPDEVERIKKSASDQALETIRNRIDEFGVSEPDIRKQGDNRILIQLPGIKDTKNAKELIGKTAVLEFRLVDDDHNVQQAIRSNPPPGTVVLYDMKKNATTGVATKNEPYLISKEVLLTGAFLTDARLSFDSMENKYFVSIDFDRKGAKKFADITGKNIHRRLAIVLDNTVYSAPVIQDKIAGGHARITGNFSPEEGKVLSIALRAGALPAPVKILEERTVGPTLGMDSIKKGLMSMAIGGGIVIIFMIIYYNGAGLIADVALVLNILLMAAGLAMVQATLTLPGIAGFILTIGMAVDANVLIFERIREESRLGQSPAASIAAGFEKATLTILDANVTTLIAALVLFQFGTGPVKGFAVTLSLGIVASLFTSLIVSRMFFDFMISKFDIKKLSI
ncbi:MAG: protein translocase subunit SecD [Proteobacteria bacterium]|nr:protein translocase subunit SecD [Pseudomonadota bacterium]